MSLQNAVKFISKVDTDKDFRKLCYQYKTQFDLLNFAASQQLKFTADEMEDAFNSLELKCQTYEQAEKVHELKAWFKLFR
ncbi:conserved hypothetical protein [uncultured Paludibacter sp.]|uniref:Nif11 domain-containing protein n=1 Tax=uncultured Paludibacter sp. TaxID=497635 RepID=A0A653A9E4_9BACT|nr:conserved hypothetical protein [uncultured Paludibacter sp.]